MHSGGSIRRRGNELDFFLDGNAARDRVAVVLHSEEIEDVFGSPAGVVSLVLHEGKDVGQLCGREDLDNGDKCFRRRRALALGLLEVLV